MQTCSSSRGGGLNIVFQQFANRPELSNGVPSVPGSARFAERDLKLLIGLDFDLPAIGAFVILHDNSLDAESTMENSAFGSLHERSWRLKNLVIGIISDTHGLLRPEALTALRGSAFIVHAGDVGNPEILERLNVLAPVTAVRGNLDRDAWPESLPETQVLEAGEVSIYILHDLQQLDLKPEAAGFRAVIHGHSHKPRQEMKNSVLYFNPGSAGPRRFQLPVTVGRLIVRGTELTSEIIPLL